MPDDIEIYRSAKLLIERRGALGAKLQAARRADELLARGDMDGKLV